MWLASFKQHSAVHGKAGKSATSVGLRAPAGRFDAARGKNLDTSDGRRAVVIAGQGISSNIEGFDV